MDGRRGWQALLGLIGGAACLVGMAGPTPVAAQDASPAATPEAACTVEPRSTEDLAALADRAATPAAAGEPTVPSALPAGEPVDAATLAEIEETLDQVTACEAAGDLPRLLALYTDAYVERQVFAAEPVEILAGTPRPEPSSEETDVPSATVRIVTVEDTRLLDDGRVAALVTSDGEAEIVVFARVDGRWLIDGIGPAETPAASPEASPVAGVSDEVLALPAVQAALADAVARLGVPMDGLTVTAVEPVVWPDASLGCPEEGQFYAQVETPGYRVKISGADRSIEYHTDESGIVVACDEGGS